MQTSRLDRSPVAVWWRTIDRWFLAAFLSLMGLGVVLSFAASPAVAERIGLDSFHFATRQIIYMIPALGAFLVWVPAAIYLAAMGDWGKALILVVWGGAEIGSIDNFLRPRLLGKKTGMHDLVIFFSVLGGLKVFGILGLFVGPVVVAVALSIVEVFKEASVAWREPPKAPVIAGTPATVVEAGGTDMPAHPMEIDPPR